MALNAAAMILAKSMSKKYTDESISEFVHLSKVVATQTEINGYIADPTTAKFNVIYLFKDPKSSGTDKYFEYQRLGDDTKSTFECTGDTSTDLSDYVQKENGKGLSTNDYDANEKAEVAKIKDKLDSSKVVSSFSETTLDTNVPSEKLVKSELDTITNKLSNLDDNGKIDYSNVKNVPNNISDKWGSKSTWSSGEYCIHNNILWKCIIASGSTSVEPSASAVNDWTACKVANEIKSINSNLNAQAIPSTLGTTVGGAINSLNTSLTNKLNTFTYLGSTNKGDSMVIPTNADVVYAFVYLNGEASNVIPFTIPCNFYESRTYRSGIPKYYCAIHNNTDRLMWLWSAKYDDVDALSTSKVFWYYS